MFPMTPQSLAKLHKELHHLITVERPRIIQEIAKARLYGDLSENAEYQTAKEKQRQIEGKARSIDFKISNAQVIDISTLSGPRIVFGATVTLFDEEKNEQITYQIVGIDEADVSEKKIAINSALAKELIGKEEGMIIDVTTPRGEKIYRIDRVQYIA